MNKIKNQYDKWIYPKPIEDIKQAQNDGLFQTSDASLFWDIFYPEKKFSNNLKVFIAGCGSSQAISLALSNPNWNIYGVDLSSKAIDLNKTQIRKYNLKNLKVENKDILDVNKENEFDLVISTGVIHHTKNPKESLKKIISTANEDGAINIMLYASYLRVGVYYLQSIFKYMNVSQDQEGVDFVKFFLENKVPEYHYVNNYEKFGLLICLTRTRISISGYLTCGISSGWKNSVWSTTPIWYVELIVEPETSGCEVIEFEYVPPISLYTLISITFKTPGCSDTLA